MFVFIWGIFLETIWKSSAMANISKANTIAVKLRKICTQTQNWGFDAAVIDHRLFSKCHLQTIISPRKGLTDAKVVTFFWDLRKLHLWCHEFCELGILQRILDDSHAPTHLLAHLPSFDFTVSQHHHCTHLAYIDSCHRWELDGEKTLPWNSWFAEVGIVHLCSIILLQTFLLSMGDFLNLLLTTSEVWVTLPSKVYVSADHEIWHKLWKFNGHFFLPSRLQGSLDKEWCLPSQNCREGAQTGWC